MSQQPNPQAEQLVQEGIEAVKAKDKALARGKLEAAVKIDPYNEKAWFWLASVVETAEEKRTCLGNVILINPQNARAHEMLAKLEGKSPSKSSDLGEPSGSSASKKTAGKRNPLVMVGAVGGFLLVCLVLFVVLRGGGGGNEVAELPTVFPTYSNEQLTATASSPTPSATATASITPTSNATWTPVPQATTTPSPVPLPSLTTGLSGRIIFQSGRSIVDANNQPIFVYNAADGSKIEVSTEGQRGKNPALVPGQARFAWQQYSSGTRILSLSIQSFGVPQSISLSSLVNNDPVLSDTSYPTWYNTNLAFAAKYPGSIANDLWLLPVSAAIQPTIPAFGAEVTPTVGDVVVLAPTEVVPPSLTPEGFVAPPETATFTPSPTPIIGPIGNSGLVRLTADAANKTWMTFDPTGTALVFVMEQDGVTDLRVINLNSLQVFVLTENGSALTESAPDWNADNEIIFSASAAGSDASDIYMMSADGSAEPTILFDYGLHDIQPRFSPDGRYVVFSSDRNGNWDVFAYDRQDGAFYAIETNPDNTDIANDWTE